MIRSGAGVRADVDGDAWLVSFADLISLLLGFFIIVAAASQQEGGMEQIQNSIQQLVGEGARTSFFSKDPGSRSSSPPWLTEGEVLSVYHQVLDQVQSYLVRSQTHGRVWAEMNDRGVTLIAADSMLFAPGSARLDQDALRLVDTVAALLERFPLNLEIRGHTDDLPIATERYPSNWALSAARAAAVAGELTLRGVDGKRLEVIGYAESRPLARPLAGSPVGLEKVRARNRRVELFLVHPLAPPGMINRRQAEVIRTVGVGAAPRLATDPAESGDRERERERSVRVIPAVPELPGFPGSERIEIVEQPATAAAGAPREAGSRPAANPFNGVIRRGE